MKAFRALTLNVVRSSMRNRIALFFTLGLAVLFMVLFGLLFGGTGVSLKLDIVDNDSSSASRSYIDALGKVNGLTISDRDRGTAFDDLKKNNVTAVLVVPAGFGSALSHAGPPQQVQIFQGSQTSAAASITDQVVGQVTAHVAGSGQPSVSLAQPQSAAVNQVSAIDFFLPAMIGYIILQSGINYVAIGLVDLRVRQVLRRFRATPLSSLTILSAQIVGGALTVLLQLVVLTLIGLFVFNAHNYGNWALVSLVVVLGTAAFVGIGFLLTSAARTSEAARGLAALVAFPMMFLSGIFFPITDLPQVLQTVIRILPLAWLSDALHQVMNDGAGIAAIAADCLVLAGWAVATFAIATWRFRWD